VCRPPCSLDLFGPVSRSEIFGSRTGRTRVVDSCILVHERWMDGWMDGWMHRWLCDRHCFQKEKSGCSDLEASQMHKLGDLSGNRSSCKPRKEFCFLHAFQNLFLARELTLRNAMYLKHLFASSWPSVPLRRRFDLAVRIRMDDRWCLTFVFEIRSRSHSLFSRQHHACPNPPGSRRLAFAELVSCA